MHVGCRYNCGSLLVEDAFQRLILYQFGSNSLMELFALGCDVPGLRYVSVVSEFELQELSLLSGIWFLFDTNSFLIPFKKARYTNSIQKLNICIPIQYSRPCKHITWSASIKITMKEQLTPQQSLVIPTMRSLQCKGVEFIIRVGTKVDWPVGQRLKDVNIDRLQPHHDPATSICKFSHA